METELDPNPAPATPTHDVSGVASAAPCSAWARHTIMDGKVVTYSTSFRDEEGVFGPTKKADGHFEVSASRNCVMVHWCEIRTDWQLETFKAAIDEANRMHCFLATCDGRPKWNQPPGIPEPNTEVARESGE